MVKCHIVAKIVFFKYKNNSTNMGEICIPYDRIASGKARLPSLPDAGPRDRSLITKREGQERLPLQKGGT